MSADGSPSDIGLLDEADAEIYPEPVHGTLLACKRDCYKLVTILYKNRTADTIDLLSTVASCNKVLQKCGDEVTAGESGEMVVPTFLMSSFSLLKSMLATLQSYKAALVRLISGGKVSRFLTSTKVRKQLEVCNVNLFSISQKLEKKLNNKRLKEIIDPQDDILKELEAEGSSLLADSMAAAFWEDLAADQVMIGWDAFLVAIRHTLDVSGHDAANLRSVLDSSSTGYVSIYSFSNYIKCFGPFAASLANLEHILRAGWFHGFITAYEASRILEGSVPGTFLVRFSSTQPGNFVLSVVADTRTIGSTEVQHTMVQVAETGLVVKEIAATASGSRSFSNLHSLVRHYRQTLTCPYSSVIFQYCAFYGDMTRKEAKDALKNRDTGTYLFRFSESSKGYLAVTFVNKKGKVQDLLIRAGQEGFRFSGKAVTYCTLQELSADNRDMLSAPLLSIDFDVESAVDRIFTQQSRPVARVGEGELLPDGKEAMYEEAAAIVGAIFASSDPFQAYEGLVAEEGLQVVAPPLTPDRAEAAPEPAVTPKVAILEKHSSSPLQQSVKSLLPERSLSSKLRGSLLLSSSSSETHALVRSNSVHVPLKVEVSTLAAPSSPAASRKATHGRERVASVFDESMNFSALSMSLHSYTEDVSIGSMSSFKRQESMENAAHLVDYIFLR